MAQKKGTGYKTTTSPAKRTTSAAAKKASSVAKKKVKATGKKAAKAARSTAAKICPYIFMVLSLILAVCFLIIYILGLDDGAGMLGYGIWWLLGGLLGGGAAFLPLLFGYLGVKWCIYNVRWKESDFSPSSANYEAYRKAKSRMVLQSTMACLTLLMISVMFGIFPEYSSLDLAEMWTDSAEELFMGGGVLGSSLACLMILAFQKVVSIIILVILILLFAILAVGITPDYIIGKLEDRRLARAEEKLREAQNAPANTVGGGAVPPAKATRVKNAPAASEMNERAEPKQSAADRRSASMSVDEIMNPAEPALKKIETIEARESNQNTKASEANAKAESDPIDQLMANFSSSSSSASTSPSTSAANSTATPKGTDYGVERRSIPEGYDSLDRFSKNKSTAEAAMASATLKENTIKEKPAENLDLTQIGEDELLSDVSAVAPEEGAEEIVEEEIPTPYVFPSLDLLAKNQNKAETDYTAELQENARRLVETLRSFKINIQDINYSRGPTITRYELRPEAGVRVRSIANLVDDIALSLATSGVRIEAPIPGKPAVGIEVPNRNRATVYLRDLIDNPQFTDAKSKLTASLGMDVGGHPIYFDITKMPHMIIAGATGMGKSVCINCIIISILYKARPEDVKLILVDPKKVEFALYKDIPHLYAPIVSDPKKAAGALASAVAEMERRFELIEEVGVRDITSYNTVTENDPYKEHLPHMVIIIDELADLMMTAPDEVESAICRLAQKARAAGIHIIIGTQRPSVDVITGLIKANIPSRIACTVASQVDSRTIIDIAGAEKLIGRGDMLFAPVGASKPLRVQGAFVTEREVEDIATFIRENNTKAKYDAEFLSRIEEEAAKCGVKKGSGGGESMLASADAEGGDSKFREAVKLAVEEGKISTSLMQRRLGVGYGRAAKIIDTMEQMGYVSKPDGNKPRRVLLSAEEYSRRVMEGTLGDADE